MLSVQYYHLLKRKYRKEVAKSQYIYIYTTDSVVDMVLFRYRKENKNRIIKDVPHEKLILSYDKKLPNKVFVQVKFNPLTFTIFES